METIKLEITDNAIQMLHSDALDFSEFGEVTIQRASNVEFSNEAKAWEVSSAKTGKLLKGGFHTRDEALKWEKEYYSPDGEGWAELTNEEKIPILEKKIFMAREKQTQDNLKRIEELESELYGKEK